jgi:proline iminopeptidase
MPPIPPPREDGRTRTTPVPLYWCAYGPAGAPRLLVLHGGPGAHHDYLLPQMLRLADDGFELVLYDQRGGGRSKTDDRAPITWRTHVDDLALVCRELGLERPAVVGYSWGALLAMLAAVVAAGGSVPGAAGGPPPAGESTPAGAAGRHQPGAPAIPPLPRALALIDPAPVSRAFRDHFEAEFARRQAGDAVRRLRDELAASGLRERSPAEFAQRQFELAVAGYFAHPERARDLTPFRVTGRVQQQVWESLGAFDLVPALGLLRGVPSLVVHGREDPIPLASSEAAAHAMGARLAVLDDSGHVPYVEQPLPLFAALAGFLRAHAA